jgi:hypothetical protein
MQMLLVGALWKASGGVLTVEQLLGQSEPYEQTSSGGLDLCETVSEWITEGSPGTITTVLATAKLFQQLTALELIIVELVLVCKIYGIAISPSGLTTLAVNAGFETCDAGQLSLIEANLYCQLS